MTERAPIIQPLRLLSGRFTANVEALKTQCPELAAELASYICRTNYFLIIDGDHLQIGHETPAGIEPLTSTLPPAVAAETIRRLYPSGDCDRATLIVGEDIGWLWNAIYRCPCRVAMLPGHRPPLYFLIRDIEQLWLMLHVQEWGQLLADPRVILLVGPGSVERFRAGLVTNTMLPWPLASIVVDPSMWPDGVTLGDVRAEAQRGANDRLTTLRHMQELMSASQESSAFSRGGPLRILGISSRYTTFLQHSMRDWLAGFQQLGHHTHLLIEAADHELPNSLAVAETCLDFQPDLIVAIDHYRNEMTGVPAGVPVVMWVQDYLPNIFSTKAGAAQGDNDYVVGFAGLKLIHEFGYPATRIIPALVGVDETRFSNSPCPPAELDSLRCEASFVSHASTPAHVMLMAEVDRLATPAATRLLTGMFDRLVAIYDAGGIVTEPVVIERMIESTMIDTQTSLTPANVGQLTGFFSHKINNALFRHQSLQWLADAGVDLRLYGNGWEKHPTLSSFAQGPAEHGEHLRRIYQASAINLQITPHGVLHQRLFEGLCAGGFFLMRSVPGDELERHFRAIAQWCDRCGIEIDTALRSRATPAIRQHLGAIAESMQLDPFKLPCSLVETVQWSQVTGYMRSSGTVWGDDYDAVAYRSRDDLLQKTNRFLADPSARRELVDRMRSVVTRRFTYAATSRRLLARIAGDDSEMPRFSSAA